MTFGYSRDDVGTFLPDYLGKGILPADPFQTLDTGGVGQLIDIGVTKGRKTRPDLKVGICGEHGGDPKSVHFCHKVGMDYVSCSPFRVPIARLGGGAGGADGWRTRRRSNDGGAARPGRQDFYRRITSDSRPSPRDPSRGLVFYES